jgi:hypothetical protein
MDLKLIETAVDADFAENILKLSAILKKGRLKKINEDKSKEKERIKASDQWWVHKVPVNESWIINAWFDPIKHTELRPIFSLTPFEETELVQTLNSLKDHVNGVDISITIDPESITIFNLTLVTSFKLELFDNTPKQV